METLDCIKGRRSIREFTSARVEKEKLITILECARWAPSSGNIQDWAFVVVEEEARKVQIAEAALGQYWMARASVIIVVCSRLERARMSYGKRGEELYTLQNTAAATQNILLACHDLGLAACWVGAFDEGAIRRILKIPDEARPVALIPIGYPGEKPPAPGRLGLDRVVFLEEYGKRWK
jgi:nitroreductase